MNKKWMTVSLVCALVAAIALFFMWKLEKSNREDVEFVCQASAIHAYEDFRSFQDTKDQGCYWRGVAEFRTFMQTYFVVGDMMDEGSNTNYLWCEELYGRMTNSPDKVQEKLDDLIAAMELLAEDMKDENGFEKVSCLNQAIPE